MFALDGELWDSIKSGAVQLPCLWQELLHKTLLPQLFPTSGKLFLAYSSSELLPPSCPCTGSASWPESRGVRLSSVSLHPFPTQKLFMSIPTCSSTLRHKVEIICVGVYLLFQLPRIGALLDSGWLVLEYREILTHIIPTSPNRLIFKFSQSFQSFSNIQFWSRLLFG